MSSPSNSQKASALLSFIFSETFINGISTLYVFFPTFTTTGGSSKVPALSKIKTASIITSAAALCESTYFFSSMRRAPSGGSAKVKLTFFSVVSETRTLSVTSSPMLTSVSNVSRFALVTAYAQEASRINAKTNIILIL